MDNATVASMQGTAGRTGTGAASGVACQQMPLSFLKGGETGTIVEVKGTQVALNRQVAARIITSAAA